MRVIETTCVPENAETKTSPIFIGEGALDVLPSLIEGRHYDEIVILHDEAVRLIAESVQQRIGHAHLIPIASGEQSKSLVEVEGIAEILLQICATRRSLLINVGGGVTTDLGGFVAGTYMRGIHSINIPTSLLGMVDAAIGGKNGVNIGKVKNVLGSVHHPVAVVEDLATLRSLPDVQIPEGLAEMIKIAAIADAELFALLESRIAAVLRREPEAMEECIAPAVAEKVRIVEMDPFDHGERNKLNYGHKMGHAEEALSSWKISHGQAVSRGMVAELAFSSMPERARGRLITLLGRAGLQTELSDRTASEFWSKMRNDKQSGADGILIAVPDAIGKGSVQILTEEEFRAKFPRMKRR